MDEDENTSTTVINIHDAPEGPFQVPMVAPQRQCCGNCLYYLATSPHEGICRAMPPMPIMIGMGRPAIEFGGVGGGPQPVINGFFAPVAKHIWCGFWKPAIGKGGQG